MLITVLGIFVLRVEVDSLKNAPRNLQDKTWFPLFKGSWPLVREKLKMLPRSNLGRERVGYEDEC